LAVSTAASASGWTGVAGDENHVSDFIAVGDRRNSLRGERRRCREPRDSDNSERGCCVQGRSEGEWHGVTRPSKGWQDRDGRSEIEDVQHTISSGNPGTVSAPSKSGQVTRFALPGRRPSVCIDVDQLVRISVTLAEAAALDSWKSAERRRVLRNLPGIRR
jgi:hypothetical protein